MKLREELDKLVNEALDLKESEETLESKVRDWYVSEFEDDDLGKEINPDVTFADVDKDLKNVYDILGPGDSIIRERVFDKLSQIKGVDYDEIYYGWLGLNKPADKQNITIKEDNDMIQCVIKVEDIGNGYKYLGMIEDNSNYASEYDMEVEYEDADLGRATIQYILAYHEDGDNKHFFDEEGDTLDLDMEEQEQFEKDYQDAINSKDNTVIPDKDMIESVNEEITPSKFKKADLKSKSIKELKGIIRKEFQKIPPFINDMSKEEIIDMLCEPDFD